jgi:hypothetical protein
MRLAIEQLNERSLAASLLTPKELLKASGSKKNQADVRQPIQ